MTAQTDPAPAPAASDTFLSPQQLAKRWGGAVSSATLANWRAKKRGPSFVKVGTRIRYRLSDVLAYEAENTCTPTAD